MGGMWQKPLVCHVYMPSFHTWLQHVVNTSGGVDHLPGVIIFLPFTNKMHPLFPTPSACLFWPGDWTYGQLCKGQGLLSISYDYLYF